MQRHDFPQGSPEWLAHRATCFNAGDAAAMLACSTKETRNELLARLHSGLNKEFSDYVQENVIDPGHDFEEWARPLAEEIVGEDLGRVVGSIDARLSRPLGASFDGITFMGDTTWEHKRLNKALREAFGEIERQRAAGALNEAELCELLPKEYRVQMEQGFMVSGAKKCLFMATDWTPDGTLIEEHHCWYSGNTALRKEVLGGWKQCEKDLAAYVPVEVIDKPVGKAVTALPSVVVQVSGEIAVRDNLQAFELALRDFVDNRLIRKPSTDQDFADLDLQIKALKKAEEALNAAEAAMLAQVASVDQTKRLKDMLHKLARDNRLMAEKLMAARKEEVKGEKVAGGIAALRAHVAALNERLGVAVMPNIPADFAGAIKGLRTIESLDNAVNSELTRAKIAASDIADRIEANLKHLREHADEFKFLFADATTIVLKAPEDLHALVTNRINDHKRKEEQRLEAERERIRAEEQTKAQREADARIAAERKAAEEAATAESAKAAKAAEQVKPVIAAPAANADPFVDARPPFPAAEFQQIAQAPDEEKPTLTLGEINTLLGFVVKSDFLASLGFDATVHRNACLYRESDVPKICAAIAQHLAMVVKRYQPKPSVPLAA